MTSLPVILRILGSVEVIIILNYESSWNDVDAVSLVFLFNFLINNSLNYIGEFVIVVLEYCNCRNLRFIDDK